MTPAVGQMWRAPGTGSGYRIAEIDLERVGECVKLRLVEPGPWLLADLTAAAERSGGTVEDEVRFAVANLPPLWVELAWFERSGTFVREVA